MNNLNADPELGKRQIRAIDPKSVPGWGVDLDPKRRPGVPREAEFANTGAHWDEPEQQGTEVEIFVSIERPMITPVFGTSCPPHGLSGILRRAAYKLGEDKKRRWLTLIFADRVDAVESALGEFFIGRKDEQGKRMPNPVNWVLFAGLVAGVAAGSAALVRSRRSSVSAGKGLLEL